MNARARCFLAPGGPRRLRQPALRVDLRLERTVYVGATGGPRPRGAAPGAASGAGGACYARRRYSPG